MVRWNVLGALRLDGLPIGGGAKAGGGRRVGIVAAVARLLVVAILEVGRVEVAVARLQWTIVLAVAQVYRGANPRRRGRGGATEELALARQCPDLAAGGAVEVALATEGSAMLTWSN